MDSSTMSKAMKVKIRGDGHPQHWEITNADTGQAIEASKIVITCTNERVELTITVDDIDVELTDIKTEFQCNTPDERRGP